MSRGCGGAFLSLLMFAFVGSVLADGPPPTQPLELTGVAQYVAWGALTGQMFAAPSANFCPIVEARLTRGPGFFVRLFTTEDCGVLLRDVKWEGVLGYDGSLALKLPKYATMRFTDGSTVKIDVLATMTEHTGCDLTAGTLPVYYGHFDGRSLHANGEFQSICTGGTMWGPMFGVSEAAGPIHADFLISLEVRK